MTAEANTSHALGCTITVQAGKIEFLTSSGVVVLVPRVARKILEAFLVAMEVEEKALASLHSIPEKVRPFADIRQQHASAYAAWTHDQEAELTRRFHAGESLADIATTMGRNAGGIRSRLRKLGLDPSTSR